MTFDALAVSHYFVSEDEARLGRTFAISDGIADKRRIGCTINQNERQKTIWGRPPSAYRIINRIIVHQIVCRLRENQERVN